MLTKIQYFISLFCCTWTLFLSCSFVPKQEELNLARDYIQQADDIGKDTIRLKEFLKPLIIDPNQRKRLENQIIYKTLLAKGIYLAEDIVNPQSTQYFNEAIARSKELENKALEIWTNISAAQYYYNFREVEAALPYFLQVSFLIDQVEPAKQIDPGKSYQLLSHVFETLGEQSRSMGYLKKALEITADTSQRHADLLGNIGMVLLQEKDTTQAFAYFKKAEESALLLNNLARLARVKGCFSEIYLGKNDLNSALLYVDEDIRTTLIAKDSINLVYARLLKSKILIQKKEYQQAKMQVDLAHEFVFKVPYLAGYQMQVYEMQYLLAKLMGKEKEELSSGRTLFDFQNSNKYGERQDAITRAQLLLNKESYLNNLKVTGLQLDKAKFGKKMYAIIALMTALLAIGWYYSQKKDNKARTEKYQRKVLEFQLEKSLLDQRLNEANHTLQDYLNFMTEKNEQIEGLQDVIEKINHSKSAHLEEKNGKLKQVLKSHLLTEENWIRFKQAFEKQYPKYYTTLKRRFPDLTENNLKFILLLKLGLSSLETSNILGVSLEAVKKNKQRLKKRMGDQYEELMELI